MEIIRTIAQIGIIILFYLTGEFIVLPMKVVQHGAAHRAFIAEILARPHLIANAQTRLVGNAVMGKMGIIAPLAIGMGDPDIVVVAFLGRAA